MFNEFRKLDYESFENIVQAHCKKLIYTNECRVNKQTGKSELIRKLESVTAYKLDLEILLPAGLNIDEEYKYVLRTNSDKGPLTPSFLCKCRKHPEAIPDGIRKAYLKDDADALVADSFNQDLTPLMHGDDRQSVIEELLLVIDRDNSIPRVYRDKFEGLAKKESLSLFLATIFVYVMTKDISTRIIELEEEERERPHIHPLVKQVLDDVAQFGDSSYLIPVLDLLYAYTKKVSIIDALYGQAGEFSLADIAAFVMGTFDLRESLPKDRHFSFFTLSEYAHTEISRRYLEEYDRESTKLRNRLLEKYPTPHSLELDMRFKEKKAAEKKNKNP